MKFITLFLCIYYVCTPIWAQTTLQKLEDIEQKWDLILPNDYKNFINTLGTLPQSVSFRLDNWTFGDFETNEKKTQELIAKDILESKCVVIAYDYHNVLFLRSKADKHLGSTIFLADIEDRNIFAFYAFSISELSNFPIVERLKKAIKPNNFKSLSLMPIQNCVGSMYQHAHNLRYYEDEGGKRSTEMYKESERIYKLVAEKGHPWALTSLAVHYDATGGYSTDSLLNMYRQALVNGAYDEMKEFAGFIMDNKPELISEAYNTLVFLLKKEYHKSSILLRLTNIFTNPKYNMVNHTKAMQYLQEAVDMGDYIAKSKLAFYYLKGIGVTQDLEKAYLLLHEANEADIKKWGGEGHWADELKALKKLLKK